jgi:hypothetical protein
MSVQSPAERLPVVCQHRWVDPTEKPLFNGSVLFRIPIIGQAPGMMRPGKTYVCQDCGCRAYIKHRIVAPFDCHIYCNCGFGYTGIEELQVICDHIERCNARKW